MKYKSFVIKGYRNRIQAMKFFRLHDCLSLQEAVQFVDKTPLPFLYPQITLVNKDWLDRVRDGRTENGINADSFGEKVIQDVESKLREAEIDFDVVETRIITPEEQELEEARNWFNKLGSREKKYVENLRRSSLPQG